MIASCLALIPACASNPAPAVAARGALVSARIRGQTYLHQVYYRNGGAGARTLYLFLEGDGRPWSDDGQKPSDDPTPFNPLALRLAAATPGSVAWLGRPCQFTRQDDPACAPAVWTRARYSADVVASLAGAANELIARLGAEKVALIGYSGGGALAVLMAPQIRAETEVVTIAANLDLAAWTAHHHYEPLSDSLDPALAPPLPKAITQRHLVGGRDQNVPPELNQRYFRQMDDGLVLSFPDFDHRCCWLEQWPALFIALWPPHSADAAAPATSAAAPAAP